MEGVPYVDLTKIDGPLPGYGLEDKLLLVCNKGKRAYLTQNRLRAYGYKNVKVLEGGNLFTSFE